MPCIEKLPIILSSLTWTDYHPGSTFLNSWVSHSSLFIWPGHCQTSAKIGIRIRRMHQAAKPVYSLPHIPLVIELLDLAIAWKAVLWSSLWNGVVSLEGIYHFCDVLVAVMCNSGHTSTFWNCTFPVLCIWYLLKMKQYLNNYKASLEGKIPLGHAAEKTTHLNLYFSELS